ncbi:MAG: cytochrome c [Acidobacteriaceae bacterium]|jgi:mono/diheme cytochrome c family protein
MKHLPSMLLLGGMILAASLAVGQNGGTQKPKSQHASSPATHQASADRGQQVFQQNCSRCHNAPEGFPPSISGTIATHMRVRASLSEADYKALLRYLNP